MCIRDRRRVLEAAKDGNISFNSLMNTPIMSKLTDIYQGADNYWKIYSDNFYQGALKTAFGTAPETLIKGSKEYGKFLANVDDWFNTVAGQRFIKIDPISGLEKTPVQALEEASAYLVTNTIPTYSKVPMIIENIRNLPLGNFVAFPAEILRTTANIINIGARELTSTNPFIRQMGARRLVGVTTVLGGIGYTVQKGAQYMTGVDEETMKAFQTSFAPPYQKNSTLIPTSVPDENGNFKYYNFSYSNPYDSLVAPVNGILNAFSEGRLRKENVSTIVMDSLFGGALDGFGGINFWQNLGGAINAGFPAVLGGLITVDQLIASVTQGLIGADAAGVDLFGNPHPLGTGYMRFTHPVKSGGLINSDHGDQVSSSIFGEMYYQLDDTTKLTFGLRYDDNDPEYSSYNAIGDANAAGAAMGVCARANNNEWTRRAGCGVSFGTQPETAVTGKLAIQKNLSDDVMVYALYSTGNKPGGTSPNNAGDILPYNGTDSSNLEFGVRSILAGGRVLLNATVFQADFKDAHNSMIYGLSAITNTLDYTHTGLEVQSRYLLGENTSLDINLFALDSEIGNDQALYDPINPFGLTSNDQLNFARDEAGLAAILYQALTGSIAAGGIGAQIAAGIADAIGPAMAFCNWGLYASVGVFGKCQGTFVVNPGITSQPGLAAVVNQDMGGNRMPATSELDYNLSLIHI